MRKYKYGNVLPEAGLTGFVYEKMSKLVKKSEFNFVIHCSRSNVSSKPSALMDP